MHKLIAAVSAIQSQLGVIPGVIKRLSRDEGTVTVSAFAPGSQRDEDALMFSILFVAPDDYPESPAWLMSDNTAICDMLSAVADEFNGGATLELVLTRVLSLFGHEPDILQHLFAFSENATSEESHFY